MSVNWSLVRKGAGFVLVCAGVARFIRADELASADFSALWSKLRRHHGANPELTQDEAEQVVAILARSQAPKGVITMRRSSHR
jgi:hypothetical protein